MLLIVIILVAVVAKLWHDLRALTDRVEMMEGGVAVPTPSPWSPPEAVPDPAPPLTEPDPEPEPEFLPFSPERWASAPEPQAVAPSPRLGFEEVFGRTLPIWAGGVTLTVAGFLIVRYSIETGLLSPLVRVALAFAFGAGLLGGAEAARRRAERVADPRVAQALSGAGIATLYGAILAAANLYALVGPVAAFAGMAGVTLLAGALSVRFGAPSAALGLVGGLAAPALVGSGAPDVPLLTLYLALAVGGLCALGRRQGWWWLGAAALAGGFGWGALLVLGGTLGPADALAVGLYTLALGIALPLLLVGEPARLVRLAGAVLGCAQLAALVAVGGFAGLHWALFGLISVAILWLSRREKALADLPALALGVGGLLAFAWPHPTPAALALLLVPGVAIHALPAAWRLWRAQTRPVDAPIVAGVALATGLLPIVHFPEPDTALACLAGAALAAGVAAWGWRVPSRGEDARFATLALTAAALGMLAGIEALPAWAWPPCAALLALALNVLAGRAADPRVERGGWGFALVAAGLLPTEGAPVRRLFGGWEAAQPTAFAGWAIPAGVAAILAWRAPRLAKVLQPAAVLIGYGTVAQAAPAAWLPVVAAAMLAALAATRRPALLPATSAAAGLSLLWALPPLLVWTAAGLQALAGEIVPVAQWPSLTDTGVRIALAGVALGIAAWRLPMPPRLWRATATIAGVALTITAHLLVKQLFAIDDPAAWTARATAERAAWEALLAVAAIVAGRLGHRRAGVAVGAASLLHFGWLTLVVANPLWRAQVAGPWLLAGSAVAAALLWLAPRLLPEWRRPRDWAAMALAVLGGFTLLRQAAYPPMLLTAGTGEGEQIARSVLAIALAGGFLPHGIRARARDWRIASLALMLAAVVKVFLFDAAGLAGLARIASFVALGFSLIAVGWLYSRFLGHDAR